LPDGWVVKRSKTHENRAYYWNEAKRESSWIRPSEANSASTTVPSSTATVTTPVQFGALHILVKHAASRKPRSWKSDHITRTKEDALQMLKGFEEILSKAASQSDRKQLFIEMASEHSDCASAKKGGDLGAFERGKMQPAFEKAVESIAVDEITTADTDSGVHLIYRTR
jgi:NIMA-interacting peptidyl-prolyl cis-trans isomerase 1